MELAAVGGGMIEESKETKDKFELADGGGLMRCAAAMAAAAARCCFSMICVEMSGGVQGRWN